MKYFFIEKSKNLKPASVVNISGSDSRHIKNVLRLGLGDIIGLYDGAGSEYEARITALYRTGVDVAVTQQFQKKASLKIQLDIAQALLKDRKMDDLIRPLTELGATRFLPYISHRSIPQPDKKRLFLRVERWGKIAKESLKQCRRRYVMRIEETVSFEHMLHLAEDSELKIAFWEDATESIQTAVNLKNKAAVKRIFAILGPEGGFSPEEMDMAKTAGFVIASLGPRILRAETAAVTACALLQYLFGDMG